MASSTPATFYNLPGGGRLRGDAAASLMRMRAAGMPSGGIDVYSRTLEKQKELYSAYKAGRGPLAAPPNPDAPHVRGCAIDLQTTRNGKYAPSAAHVWLSVGGDGSSKPKAGEKLRAHSYGWYRTAKPERWHYTYNPARDTEAKADLAARLKKLGAKNVKAFQRDQGLTVDGKAGPQTWTALLLAGDAQPKALGDRMLRRGDRGADVAELSELLTDRWGYQVGNPVDVFGPMIEAAVKSEQRKAGLVDDGVAGPKTLAALRATPTESDPEVPTMPAPEPTPSGVAFRFGLANLQAARFGGISDTSPRRGRYLADEMKCSLYVLTEVPRRSRDTIRAVLGKAWKVYPVGYIAVLWDSGKWTHRDRMSVDFGTGIHGAVRAELMAANRVPIDVIGVHVRPTDSFGGDKAKAADGKQRDIARMLSLYRKGVATIIAGDFNTSDTAALARTGLVRATPAEDTLDKAGVQPLDQVWVTPDLIVRGATLLDPGSLTDHKTWVVNLTLDGGLTPPIPASI